MLPAKTRQGAVERLHPGEWKIIHALVQGPVTFSELVVKVHLSKVSVSKYLKELREWGFVVHDEENRTYRLPKTVFPLAPASYPRNWKTMERTIESIMDHASQIRAKPQLSGRKAAFEEMTKVHLSMIAANLALVYQEAMRCRDWEVANEFVTRSMEGVFERWILLLNMVFYRDKVESGSGLDGAAAVFLTIAEDSLERFLEILPGASKGRDHRS